MATVTKRDLVIKVSDKIEMTQQQVFDVIQLFMDEITDSLSEGDDVVLRNFGSFQITVTKPKIGRNPKKPETPVQIPARAIVKFKPGKEMKDRVASALPV
ncbi:MAG: integration host factor subunit beta [Verrucomicrobiales bacterium]|nr:integration host factor subunit beta [Verrucomicrobiales bacterium]